MTQHLGNIVHFVDAASVTAVEWCIQHELPGKVIGVELGTLVIDVGLYYNVYVKPHQIIVLADTGDIHPLNQDLLSKAPDPDGCF